MQLHDFPQYENVDETIPRLAAMGYDGLEFWDQYLSKADIGRLANILKDNDIRAAQLVPYLEFTLGDERWQWSVKMAEKYIQHCLQLDCSLIRTYANCPWEQRLPFPPTGRPLSKGADATKAQWKAAVRGLKKICTIGNKHDIRFPLENTYGLLDSSDLTLKLLDEVGAENLGVNLQVPLATDQEKGMSYMDSVEKLGKHVIHVHANNYTVKDTTKGQTFLDEGWIDYEAVLKRIRGFGFDGYVSVEHASHGGYPPLEIAEHEISYLKNVVKKIEDK